MKERVVKCCNKRGAMNENMVKNERRYIMLHSLMNELEKARDNNDWNKAIYICNTIMVHCYDEFFKAQINSIKENICANWEEQLKEINKGKDESTHKQLGEINTSDMQKHIPEIRKALGGL